ncbi:MAG: hypothetical protein VB081_11565 [Christensenella sp.]|uniref:hypothetical protein n=1 Tax=Christensenella sp. TaxID=1935934 RepID=UPI002B211E8A|nr:hypothetical protein [Christensenella sp.]MEA5004124.1 hypothetical protein [Christensenella sp.]
MLKKTLQAPVCKIHFSFLPVAVALPAFDAWSYEYPSRLFSTLFSGGVQPQPLPEGIGFSDDVTGVGLGGLFVLGVILLCLGLIVLLVEYFKKTKN